MKDANLVYENGGGNSPFQFLSNQYWDDTNSIFAKDVSDAWLEAEPDNAEPYALLGAYYSAQDDENGIVELLKKQKRMVWTLTQSIRRSKSIRMEAAH